MIDKSDNMDCQLCPHYNSCKLHDGTNRKPEYKACSEQPLRLRDGE